eukprot:s717_g13.t1
MDDYSVTLRTPEELLENEDTHVLSQETVHADPKTMLRMLSDFWLPYWHNQQGDIHDASALQDFLAQLPQEIPGTAFQLDSLRLWTDAVSTLKPTSARGQVKVFHTLRWLGVPLNLLNQWYESLKNLTRIWRLDGHCSDVLPTNHGVPEGDPWSAVSIVGLAYVWSLSLRQHTREGLLSAYADNWAWAADTAEAHDKILDGTDRFVTLTDMTIDWPKCWGWATTAAQFAMLQTVLATKPYASQLSRRLSAMDLGAQHTYQGSPKLGKFRRRLERAHQRLRRLASLQYPLSTKIHLIKGSVFPMVTYGAEVLPIGNTHAQKLRTSMSIALVGGSTTRNPALAILAIPHLQDPQLEFILRAIRAARRMVRAMPADQQTDFLTIASRHSGVPAQCRGFCQYLLELRTRFALLMANATETLAHDHLRPSTALSPKQKLAAWAVATPWPVPATGPCFFQFSPWGTTICNAVLGWMQQVVWNVETAITDDDPGVSWLELLLSFVITTKIMPPIKRTLPNGQHILQTLEKWEDVEKHQIGLGEQANNFSNLVNQVHKLTGVAPWPSRPKGLLDSDFASEELQCDKEVVMEALHIRWSIVTFQPRTPHSTSSWVRLSILRKRVQVDSSSDEGQLQDVWQCSESTESFDLHACLNRGHPMKVEWDGRSKDFTDGFGLCSPTRWYPTARGLRRSDDMKKLALDTYNLLMATVRECIPDVRGAAFKLVTGKFESSPFSARALTELRGRWAGLLPDPTDALVVDEGQPFLLRGLAQWLRVFRDPDVDSLVDVEDSFASGVPLGVDSPLPRTPQVYPEKVKHRKLDESGFNPVADNYQSAQLSSAELEKKFREEEALGRMFPSRLTVLKEEFGDRVQGGIHGCHFQAGWDSTILNEVGISARRGEWLVNWIQKAAEKRYVVVTRDFAEFLGRLGFVAQLLPWLKPHLSPLFSWSAATSSSTVAKLPDAVILTLQYLLAEFSVETFTVSAKRPVTFAGERFRTDAKCTTDTVVLGGWEIESGRWFQITLDATQAPYLFIPGKGAQGASTSAELLATLASLVAFGWSQQAKSRKQLELCMTAGTDNRGNEFLSQKRSTTKWPLMAVNMQLSVILARSRVGVKLSWRPRKENTIADDITNSVYDQVDISKRVNIDYSDLPTQIIHSLWDTKAQFDAARLVAKAAAAAAPEKKRKRHDKSAW